MEAATNSGKAMCRTLMQTTFLRKEYGTWHSSLNCAGHNTLIELALEKNEENNRRDDAQ